MKIFLHINYYHHYHNNINITTITIIIIIIIIIIVTTAFDGSIYGTIVTIKSRFSVKILKAKTGHLVWFNILLPYKSNAGLEINARKLAKCE